jgi:hypothetical protein
MKGPAIDVLVYEYMFPKPKSTDPQNFQALLARQLVPEVRLETQAFYGHLSTQEAKYPGLDYSYQPHRLRLSRFPWHRRLFRAFDNLGLTKSEIAGLTKWEGTRWAKERFEKEQGIIIRDTTSEGMGTYVEPEERIPVAPQAHRANVEEMEGIQEGEEAEEDDTGDGDDSDNEIQSVGVELNERLRAAVAQREAGNPATVMDEEWEQWLKDAVEAGGLPFLSSDLSPNANIPGTRPAIESPAMHPRLLNAARLGQWQQIPDFLRNIVRQNIEANNRRMEDAAIAPPAAHSSTSSASTSTASSPFLSRPSLSPRARPVPAFSTSSFGRIDSEPSSRLVSRPEQFSRRPIPPIPSATTTSRLSMARNSRPNTGT